MRFRLVHWIPVFEQIALYLLTLIPTAIALGLLKLLVYLGVEFRWAAVFVVLYSIAILESKMNSKE